MNRRGGNNNSNQKGPGQKQGGPGYNNVDKMPDGRRNYNKPWLEGKMPDKKEENKGNPQSNKGAFSQYYTGDSQHLIAEIEDNIV